MEFNKGLIVAIYVLLQAYISDVNTKETKVVNQSACDSWHMMYQALKSQPKNEINCTEELSCTGLNCNGIYEKYNYSVGFKMNGCDDPPSIEIFCDVPELGLHHMQHTFENGEKYQLPGIHLSSVNFDLYLEVVLIKKADQVLLSLTLKPEIISFETYPLKSFQLLVNQSIVMPPCEKIALIPQTRPTIITNHIAHVNHEEVSLEIQDDINKGKECRLNVLGDCGENEICVQTSEEQKGICECREQYHRNKNNDCISNNSTDGSSSKTNFAIILGTTIPLCLALIFSACGFVIYKFGLVQKFRDYQSSSRSYEVLDIGTENDDDDVPMPQQVVRSSVSHLGLQR